MRLDVAASLAGFMVLAPVLSRAQPGPESPAGELTPDDPPVMEQGPAQVPEPAPPAAAETKAEEASETPPAVSFEPAHPAQAEIEAEEAPEPSPAVSAEPAHPAQAPEPSPAVTPEPPAEPAARAAPPQTPERLDREPARTTHRRLGVDVRLTAGATDADLERDAPTAGFFNVPAVRLSFEDFRAKDLAYTFSPLLVGTYEETLAFGIGVELAVAARLDATRDTPYGQDESTRLGLADHGSYLKLRRDLPVGEAILIVFPFHAEHMRAGFSERLAWAGVHSLAPLSTAGTASTAAPGARLEWVRDATYASVGTRATRVLDERKNELVTAWAILAGAGVRIMDALSLDIATGYLERGTLPPVGLNDVGRRDLDARGASVRLSFDRGLPPIRPVDFEHLANDPFVRDSAFEPAAGSALRYAAAVELVGLRQPLRDPAAPDDSVVQSAWGAAFTGRVGWGGFDVSALYAFESLELLLFDVPSFRPYTALPEDATTGGKHTVAGTTRYCWTSTGLAAHLAFGATLPAVFHGDVGGSNGVYDVAVRNEGDFAVLPDGAEEELIYEGKLGGSWRLGSSIAVVAELAARRDPNHSRLVRADDGTLVRESTPAQTLFGINLLIRGRFGLSTD